MKKAVVLLSGGMDSTTLLWHILADVPLRDVVALSFAYGQKHVRELEMARRQVALAGVMDHRVVDMSFFGALTAGASALTDSAIAVPDLDAVAHEDRHQPLTYVPNRNMVLLALAAATAESLGACDLFYGAQVQDEYGYWDCTQEFLDRMNAVLALNRRRPVRVHAPFVRLTKAQIVARGLELGVDFSLTWSCYRGRTEPCGSCPTCVERAKAFGVAGVPDPLTACPC